MKRNFDVKDFISELGSDLISIFERSSRQGIHPDEVGRAKEINIAKQIEAMLPSGVGVGRGFVFDSKGNISNQCDIILYEKNMIPVFVSYDNVDYSYYPCEGVIAVGEIKSTLNKNELMDSLEKLEKIKKLERTIKNERCFRFYCSSMIFEGTEEEKYDPLNKSLDNIFTFIFCKENVINNKTLLNILVEKYRVKMECGVDRVYSINKDSICKMHYDGKKCNVWSIQKSNSYVNIEYNCSSFGALIDNLIVVVEKGRTQEFELRNYYKIDMKVKDMIVL